MHSAPLRVINLPSIEPFNKLSNGVSHMQISAAVSEIQRLEHGEGCKDIVGKSINMRRFRNFFHGGLLNI